MHQVKVWKEKMIIPTYEVGKPEKYPLFLEKRVYQGSSGVVYPNAVIEQVSNEKVDKEWEVVFIENYYLKIMVMPALGGRIQMAYDKIHQRHFVYHNRVIKPALVGLTGPWISGGIEFNWPQHHRPSTYEPVDFFIKENADGSKTVWVSEIERMFRTKGMAGFTLYPDKAYLEIEVHLYNRTPHPQSFLWWANPAVAVNDHYQSVFPPDVNAVFDHGKRDVSEFPIAKGVYYKVDYAPGTDISRYKNIPVPTSYMAIHSDYDFVGGYENDSKGGLLHIADHHVSPGKKQWTWGNGDFGHAWDRNLTDEDGPYIELMCGVYTDNQPDFSWLHPYEEKSFKQYFMPYNNVGLVKNASKDVLLNLEIENGRATIKIHVTSQYPNATIALYGKGKILFQEKVDVSPEKGFEKTIEIGQVSDREVFTVLRDQNGQELISWSPQWIDSSEIPDPAKAAQAPKNIMTVEQLYLQGLHLEQYRHATYDPSDYYREALYREPEDLRCNNAMGLWLLRKGMFEDALPYFDRAIESLTRHNPNPYDGEAYFNRGLTLKFLGKIDKAYGSFFKACWNSAWQDAGYFQLAHIDCSKGNLERALDHLDKALIKNRHNHKARHLRIVLLRKMERINEALEWIDGSISIDPFNIAVLFEKYLLNKQEDDMALLKEIMRDNVHNYIEFSLDYAQSGFFEEAISLLKIYSDHKEQMYPIVPYLLGWYYEQQNDEEQAGKYYHLAGQMPKDYCFPSRLEETVVLRSALEFNPSDAKAAYYLGNFYYASRRYKEAQNCWEASIDNDDNNAICHRNLALLYFNKEKQKKLSRQHLEKAFDLDKNARLLMELDQLLKKVNTPIKERLELLEDNLALTLTRDDVYLERIALYNLRGQHQKALRLLLKRKFHPWEGGEGKVPFQYITAHVELAKKNIVAVDVANAIVHLEAAQVYPHNLGEGKLFGAQENDIFYWLGCVYEIQGDQTLAKASWEKASKGLSDPSPAIFYNDQPPDKIFYQGLAMRKLGWHKEAHQRFQNLLRYGMEHMNDQIELDYFAVSHPDLLIWEEDLHWRNKLHCEYLIGLGKLGLGHKDDARAAFKTVLNQDRYHLSAKLHCEMAESQEMISRL